METKHTILQLCIELLIKYYMITHSRLIAFDSQSSTIFSLLINLNTKSFQLIIHLLQFILTIYNIIYQNIFTVNIKHNHISMFYKINYEYNGFLTGINQSIYRLFESILLNTAFGITNYKHDLMEHVKLPFQTWNITQIRVKMSEFFINCNIN